MSEYIYKDSRQMKQIGMENVTEHIQGEMEKSGC